MQHQPAPAGRVLRDKEPQQRRLTHVEPVMPRIEAAAQLRRRIAGCRIEHDFLDRQRRLPPHHLHRLRQAFPHHRRAQDVVPIDHRLQRPRR